jgi:hypothetical protein
MAQLLHILKKDIRCFRFEFLIYAALLLYYAWFETHLPVAQITRFGVLVPVSLRMFAVAGLYGFGIFLISRMIHAEAIPGDNQFWLTRPYCWKSLLGAKVLLLLVGVSLPLLLVRLLIFRIQGFPFFPGIWQLLWSQFIITVVVGLPIAALSALTSGLVQFLVSAIVLMLAFAFVEEGAFGINSWPPTTIWFREAVAAAGLIVIALWVLYSQYSTRRTALVRTFALCGFALAGILYFHTPWSMAETVNGWFTTPIVSESSPGISLGPEIRFFPEAHGNLVDIRVPILVRGIPEGFTAELQPFWMTFRGPGGVQRQRFEPGPFETSADGRNYRSIGAVDRSFFESKRGESFTVRLSLDLVLFPPVQSETVQPSEDFVNAIGGLQCRGILESSELIRQPGAGKFEGVECRSAFDWPDLRLNSQPKGQIFGSFPGMFLSHSPFYSNALSLESVQMQSIDFKRSVDALAITAQGPPKWYHRDLELRDVKLDDTISVH